MQQPPRYSFAKISAISVPSVGVVANYSFFEPCMEKVREFTDFNKAYDFVSQPALWTVLWEELYGTHVHIYLLNSSSSLIN